eukprot:TRINITY_DN2761_c0_g1_i12.p1 TRINITY_DN2761_c0_g1~~TRINITY_DN2761_c0_g1_i12.p1  ORF type:complete len:189 (-),score=13.39 TRINITY_DN2761_c0_g1_i12:356-922(-)
MQGPSLCREPVGTPHFMAPEMIRGEMCDEKIDVWAVGVVVYTMLCGQLPFEDTNQNCQLQNWAPLYQVAAVVAVSQCHHKVSQCHDRPRFPSGAEVRECTENLRDSAVVRRRFLGDGWVQCAAAVDRGSCLAFRFCFLLSACVVSNPNPHPSPHPHQVMMTPRVSERPGFQQLLGVSGEGEGEGEGEG